ncbi:MAG: hypothetical protein WCE62_08180 [Polyangiales bacterium]
MGFANDIRDLRRQQRAGAIHWRRQRSAGINPAPEMVGRRSTWGVGLLGVTALGGCEGGITLNAIVLLVTVGIFLGTILLERSP